MFFNKCAIFVHVCKCKFSNTLIFKIFLISLISGLPKAYAALG